MLTIAFTVSCLRPEVLRKTLEAWHKVRGVQDAELVFYCEPPGRSNFGLNDFAAWAARSFQYAEVRKNMSRLGCLLNTQQALADRFARGADFVILAEEDVEPADDALEYFTWARDTYMGDPVVLTVCAHSFLCAAESSRELIVRARWFNPLLWGTWRSRWDEVIAPSWGPSASSGQGWDHNLRLKMLEQGSFVSTFPIMSRSQHTGRASTQMHPSLADFFFRQSVSTTYAPPYGTCKYAEVPRTQELGLTV